MDSEPKTIPYLLYFSAMMTNNGKASLKHLQQRYSAMVLDKIRGQRTKKYRPASIVRAGPTFIRLRNGYSKSIPVLDFVCDESKEV